jgi:hypothetical protein
MVASCKAVEREAGEMIDGIPKTRQRRSRADDDGDTDASDEYRSYACLSVTYKTTKY